MSTISSEFHITAILDGTTLHGSLNADGSLTQASSDSSISPDWSLVANQPTIYLTLLNGAELYAPDDTAEKPYTWYFNGNAIEWEGSDSTLPIGPDLILTGRRSTNGLFFKHKKNISIGSGPSIPMPALRIIGNIAGSNVVDVYPVRLDGTITQGSASIPFSTEIQIRVSRFTANGFLGGIRFVGSSSITSKGQIITMYGELYGASGTLQPNDYDTEWFLNDSETGTAGSGAETNPPHYYQVTEEQVSGEARIRCDFKVNGQVEYTAYATIDDAQDPEIMYIQYSGGNGRSASVRRNGSVQLYVWMGEANNPAVDTRWTNFRTQLLDADKQVITGRMTGVNDADSNGIRVVDVDSETHKGSLTIYFDNVIDQGKGDIFGYLFADKPIAE